MSTPRRLSLLVCLLFCEPAFAMPRWAQLDRDVGNFVEENQNAFTKRLAMVGDALGDGTYLIPGALGLQFFGYVIEDSRLNRGSRLALKALVIGSTRTFGYKLIYHRHRPQKNNGPLRIDGPGTSFSNLSFPSGHTTAAFSMASAFSHTYNTPVVSIVSYTLAAMTAFARIHNRKHWLTDTIFAALIGYNIGQEVVYKDEGKELPRQRLMVVPGVDSKRKTFVTINWLIVWDPH